MIQATARRDTRARTVDVVVIGAGHAGLAMSRSLSQASVEHVVLERGEVANSWRNERWDSLRLLTPNWQSRLPGYRYSGPEPDGFMTMPDVIEFISTYAWVIGAPVQTGTTVISVCESEDGYRVVTDRDCWRCRAVVLASGAHNMPVVPLTASTFPASIRMLTAKGYRRPQQLDDRPVLIVGASATGLQLADEIQRSGRQVMLAVGEHIRMPRTYRGRDIQHWLDVLGILDERYDQVDDIVRARRVPSPQLIGTTDRTTLDLNTLTESGVELVGRFTGVSDCKIQFSGSLRNHCAMADLKLTRLLERIDKWIRQHDLENEVGEPERFAATRVADTPRLTLNLGREGIGTILWACGFRPDYGWLHVPALDRKGQLRHEGGIACTPGLYALGLNFMRRRKSSFIHGAEDDVRELTAHLLAHLRKETRRPTVCAAG